MEIPTPQDGLITIYSKSGCSNCVKVKKLLEDKHADFLVIDCDEFILEDKPGFLQFIHLLVGHEYNTFPMVFLDKTFIGGFKNTEEYLIQLQQKNKEKEFNLDLEFNTNF